MLARSDFNSFYRSILIFQSLKETLIHIIIIKMWKSLSAALPVLRGLYKRYLILELAFLSSNVGKNIFTVSSNLSGVLQVCLHFHLCFQALDECLRHHLGKDIPCQINELTSQVKIKGIQKDAVVTVLKRLGF